MLIKGREIHLTIEILTLILHLLKWLSCHKVLIASRHFHKLKTKKMIKIIMKLRKKILNN